ncbi:hypothetical protein [Caballeronia udeis]|uniref:hypothetical protein n=1 Tax=Caballeronia udeis TaxID=1232866 RepID=UPI00384D7142
MNLSRETYRVTRAARMMKLHQPSHLLRAGRKLPMKCFPGDFPQWRFSPLELFFDACFDVSPVR